MWEALGSHQNQFSSEKNNVVKRTGQDSPPLATGPVEGWTPHGRRESSSQPGRRWLPLPKSTYRTP